MSSHGSEVLPQAEGGEARKEHLGVSHNCFTGTNRVTVGGEDQFSNGGRD